jgi:membrane protein
MKRHLLNTFDVFKEAAQKWLDDKASRQAAALTYYTIFALSPLLVLLITMVGLFLGEEAARSEVIDSISESIGEGAAEFIQGVIESTYVDNSGIVPTLLALGLLFFTASGLFNQVKMTLNAIWGVEPEPDRGIKGLVFDRLLAAAMVVVFGSILLLAVIATTVISVLSAAAEDIVPGIGPLWQLGNLALSLAILTLIFAVIYKVLPDAHIEWRDVWIGAFVTAILFSFGQFAVGIYLGISGASSAYGAAGSLIAILLWFYYTLQVILFGAEFTQVYTHKYGSNIQSHYEQEIQQIDTTVIHEVTQLEKDEDVIEVVAVPRTHPAWLGGFLGGLIVATTGLVTGLLFTDRD